MLSSPPDVAAIRAQLERAARDAGLSPGALVDIETAAPPVQRRTLKNLPPGRIADLRAMVNHQASRFFRIGSSGVVVDLAKLPDSDAYLAVAIDRDLAHGILDAAGGAGLRVRGLTTTPAPAAVRLSLLPAEELVRRRRGALRRTLWLGMATTVYAGILLAFCVGSTTARAKQAASAFTKMQTPVRQLRLVRVRLDSTLGMIRALERTTQRGSRLLADLKLVSDALPDSSVATSLTVDGDGDLELEGFALEPLEVVARLQRIPAFRLAHLDKDPVRDSSVGRSWSRFEISVKGDSGR
jgi:hypothetical protein